MRDCTSVFEKVNCLCSRYQGLRLLCGPCRTGLVPALVLGLLAFGVSPVAAQQTDEDGSRGAVKPSVRSIQPGAKSMSYYLRHPNAPIPPAVKQRVPDRMLRQIEQRRERRREDAAETNDRRTPMPNDIGGFLEIGAEQSWVLNENPNPSLNFNLTGTPQFAGDVNGDGTNDYLYAETARDERTPGMLEDRTGKTALFYGGSPSESEDQLVYAELRPVGDLNGDGFDDALQIDGLTARIWGGSQNGYVDSGVTIDLPFAPYSFPGNGVAGFTDLDGDGTSDALLFDDFGFRGEFVVLYGAGSFGNATVRTYQPPTDESRFTYNVADLEGDGTGSIVRLEGRNTDSESVRVRLFDFAGGETEILSEDFQDGQLSPMTVYNVSDGNGWAIGSSEGNVYALANGFGGAEASNSWLITPALNFNNLEAETLTFRNAKRFDDSLDTPLQVKVSTSYDGSGNPEDFAWTDITDRVENLSQGDFNYVSSGEVDLADSTFQASEVYVAFQYQSSGTGAGSSEAWQVDDIRVAGQTGRSLTETQSFTAEELPDEAGENQLSLIDITGTDTLEIAAKSRFGEKTYVFERDTDSTYAETPDSLAKDDAVPVGDLDGDGRHDFYTFEDSTDTRYVSYGPADLSEGLTFDTEIPYGDDVFGAAGFLPEGGLGDVTGDGRPDVGLSLSDNQNETVGRRFFSVNSDRTGRPPADVSYPEGHFFDRIRAAQEIGDFNGDGTDDFALVRFDLRQIEVFYGGSSISAAPDLTIESPIDEEYISITSGDYNGDGASDLAAEYNAGNRVEVFLGGSGADGQVDHVIDPDDFEFERLYYLHTIGDVNDDGADDLLAKEGFGSSGEQNMLGVFFGGSPLPNTPDETFQYSDDGYSAGRTAAAPGDVNGDGIDDFVVGLPFFSDDANARGRADVYFGGSDPSFSSPDLTLRPEDLSGNIYGFSQGLAGGDFDGDGHGDIAVRPDFVSPASTPGNVTISIFEGGPNLDDQVDRRLQIPVATGVGDEGFGDNDGLANRVRGPLAAVPRGAQPDRLIQGSLRFRGTNAVLYAPFTGDEDPIAVFRAPNQDVGMGGFVTSGSIAASDFTGSGRTDVVFSQVRDNNDAALSSRVYRYEVPGIPVASAAADVASNGETIFEGTGIAIDFSNISGQDEVTATKYLDPPVNAGTINKDSVVSRYTVDTGSGLTFGTGTELKFRTNSPPLDGVDNPGDVVVYQRSTPNAGTFTGLQTTYDSTANEIVAPIESFGEFALVSTSGPVTVWPGDTDNDGTVNQADVLPLGMYWGSSGPARSETGCSWAGQSADGWSPAAATYADANGDGTVDQDDVLCLGLNWGRSHSTASAQPLLAGPAAESEPAGRLELRLDERSGSTVWVELHAREVSSLRGVAAELSFDPSSVSITAVEPGARMGDMALLESNTDEAKGILGLGISRKNGRSPVEVSDEAVARVKLRTEADRPDLDVRNVQASTGEGATVPLATGDGLESLPDEVALSAPAPNPARQQVTLRYALPEAQSIRLSVYDIMGREVAVLVDQRQDPGRKQVRLDASQLSSGTYFYRLRAGETTKTKRLTVVR